MLEVKHLRRVYKLKKAQDVVALDDVSIKFPETGLVFILGKSGSGKSTLLNVMGGLDQIDSGEIIINNKSSKDFSGSEMDSYRNTYLGFIFQEYNILNDFTVKENIALSLKLQNKKATDKEINDILEQVDLKGMAKRKPNELSGGQKQRVAIARALVKNPEIIMADEPTGALDSNTGKQVFETLKKLSKTKLVIVVSHDRDFAEHFGDRVIELKDGKVISDISKSEVASVNENNGLYLVGDNIIRIEKNRLLTVDDLNIINKTIKESGNEVYISTDSHVNHSLLEAAKINENGNRECFHSTNQDDIKNDNSSFKAIKSTFSFKNALKMGASSLKVKPFRLVMTILLSVISFTLFGASATLARFNKVDAYNSTIAKNNLDILSVSKNEKNSYNSQFSSDQIKTIKEKTGVNFITSDDSKEYALPIEVDYSKKYYFTTINSVVKIDDEFLNSTKYKLVENSSSKMPTNSNECLISLFTYNMIKKAGIGSPSSSSYIPSDKVTYSDLIGREIRSKWTDDYLKIVGILDTSFPERLYKYYDSNNQNKNSSEEEELSSIINNHSSLHDKLFVSALSDSVESINSINLAGKSSQDLPFMLNYNPNIENRTLFFDKDRTYSSLKDDEVLLSSKSYSSFLDEETEEQVSITDRELPGAYMDGDRNEVYKGREEEYSGFFSNSIKEGAKYKTIYDNFNDFYTNNLDEVKVINEGKDEDTYHDENKGIISNYDNATNNQKYKIFKTYLENKVLYDSSRSYDEYLLDTSSKYFSSYKDNLKSYYKTFIPKYKVNYFTFDKYTYEILNNFFMRCYANENRDALIEKYKNDETFKTYISQRFQKNDASLLTDSEKIESIFYLLKIMGNTTSSFKNDYMDSYSKDIVDIMKTYDFSNTQFDSSITYGNQIGYPVKIVGLVFTPTYDGLISYANKNLVETIRSHSFYGNSKSYYVSYYQDKNILNKFLNYCVELEKPFKDGRDYDKIPNGTYYINFKNNSLTSVGFYSDMILFLTKTFIITGVIIALFSMLLFYNFMSISINNKKREIGILRAIGAKRSDVFKIFYIEATIIALINFVLASILTFVASFFVNRPIYNNLSFKLMNPNYLIVLLILAIAILASFISSLLPVIKIANKKPIEAISNK